MRAARVRLLLTREPMRACCLHTCTNMQLSECVGKSARLYVLHEKAFQVQIVHSLRIVHNQ
jgi:hypothetical protein